MNPISERIKAGAKFGMWTVLSAEHIKSECMCECGKTKFVGNSDLLQGKSKSCGHPYGIRFCKHGKSRTKLNIVWLGMRQRCFNKTCNSYKWYGERGISICPEWESFEQFETWALTSGYVNGLSIDRIDNDGNYEPSNCKWSTLYEQNNNTRNNINISFDGKTQTIAQWSRELNIPYNKLRYRKHHGWKDEEILYGKK